MTTAPQSTTSFDLSPNMFSDSAASTPTPVSPQPILCTPETLDSPHCTSRVLNDISAIPRHNHSNQLRRVTTCDNIPSSGPLHSTMCFPSCSTPCADKTKSVLGKETVPLDSLFQDVCQRIAELVQLNSSLSTTCSSLSDSLGFVTPHVLPPRPEPLGQECTMCAAPDPRATLNKLCEDIEQQRRWAEKTMTADSDVTDYMHRPLCSVAAVTKTPKRRHSARRKLISKKFRQFYKTVVVTGGDIKELARI